MGSQKSCAALRRIGAHKPGLPRGDELIGGLTWLWCYFLCFLGCCVSHSEKRAESRHPDARYLIVTQVEASDDAAASAAAAAGPSPSAAAAASPSAPDEPVVFEGTPIGFCAVRFVTGDEDHAPIAYV